MASKGMVEDGQGKSLKCRPVDEIAGFVRTPHSVKFRWIKGHAGHEWNEICDKLSKEAAGAPNLPDDDGYVAH